VTFMTTQPWHNILSNQETIEQWQNYIKCYIVTQIQSKVKISTNIRLQFKYKATTTNWRHTVHVHTIYSDTCTIVWTHVIIPDHKHKFVLKFLNSGNHDNLVNYTIFPLSSHTCTKYIWPCNHCHIYITLKQTFTKKIA
jgi:hypothetical protein